MLTAKFYHSENKLYWDNPCIRDKLHVWEEDSRHLKLDLEKESNGVKF